MSDAAEFFSDWITSNDAPETREKQSVRNDRWDRESFNQMLREFDEFTTQQNLMENNVPTAPELWADAFWNFWQLEPRLVDATRMRPSHYLDWLVMTEAKESDELRRLKHFSEGDEFAAACAVIEARKPLEALWDKLDKHQKRLEEMERLRQEQLALQVESQSIEEMIENWSNSPNPDEAEGEALAQQLQDIMDAIHEKQNEEAATAEEAGEGFENVQPIIAAYVSAALEQASEAAEASMALGWGVDPGFLSRMPAQERFELAKRINTPQFRELAKLWGAMQRLLHSTKTRRTDAQEEIFDLTLGDEISRMVPSELLLISDPILTLEWDRKYVEHSLLQYEMRGNENVTKGAIIGCLDNSGSMAGDKEKFGKAVMLCMLNQAREEKRSFHGVHFGSQHQIAEFDFTTPDQFIPSRILDFAEFFFNGGPLRIDQRVVTPSGWKAIGDMQVGDEVYGVDGTIANVIGVYPQGQLDLYEVTFSDGAKVICDSTHLWTVDLKNPKSPRRTMTLQAMMDKGLRYTHKSGGWYRYSVPMADPVQLPEAELPLDPYLLGTLLGDGSLGGGSSVQVHSSEAEHPWRSCLPSDISVTTYNEPCKDRCGSYGLKGSGRGKHSKNSIITALKELALFGVTGADKFVPDAYLWSSITQRFDLLSGLLDTDGSVVACGGFQFSNTSRNLCEAVVHLTQSLGGVAAIHSRKVRANEQPAWRVEGRLPSHPHLGIPFRLTRKREAYKIHPHNYKRSIVSAERVDTAEAICIKTDRADGLFLTEGFVVTHNTDFERPLTIALERLEKEYAETKRVEADIVFVTDGICGVSPEWLKNFKERQEFLQFKVWGILIGGLSRRDEPLWTICDGRVLTIQDILSGKDLVSMFREM